MRQTCASLHGEPDEAFAAPDIHPLLAIARAQKDAGHPLAEEQIFSRHGRE